AELYRSLQAQLPGVTQLLIALGTTARTYILVGIGALLVGGLLFRIWARTERGSAFVERVIRRLPVLGDVWVKYHVSQLSRVLSTLLIGGIPLVQALETAGESLGARVLKEA